MRSPRAARRHSSIVGVAAVLVGCSGGAASPAAPLLRIDTGTGHCIWAGQDRPWLTLRSSVIEFGLDEMKLPTRATRAVITSVVLKGTTGQLTIAKAVAVPGQAFGDGFAWGDSDGILFPAEWRDRRAVPGATVTFAPRRPGYPPDFDGMIWKIVVGLTPGPSGGSANHLEIRYRAVNRNYTFVGNARVGIYPTQRACDRFLDAPGE